MQRISQALLVLGMATALACDVPRADAGARYGGQDDAAANAGAVTLPALSQEVIRDVRVTPGTTTVQIAFTALPGTFASISMGPSAPRRMQLPRAMAEETGLASLLLLDPETTIAGWVVRSRTASYLLDTARDRPEEGSAALRPGTTYHFVISAPSRVPDPGEDEDEVPVGAQYAGTFTTRR